MTAPPLEGRRPPPCPQYRRPWRPATGRPRVARVPGGSARSPPNRPGAAPVCIRCCRCQGRETRARWRDRRHASPAPCAPPRGRPTPRHANVRSEEHTSELQSRLHLVCRLLLEKKKKKGEASIWRTRGTSLDYAQTSRGVEIITCSEAW